MKILDRHERSGIAVQWNGGGGGGGVYGHGGLFFFVKRYLRYLNSTVKFHELEVLGT